MKRGSITCLLFFAALFFSLSVNAQTKRPVYHPCFLMDSVESRLEFIRINASRIFVDTFDCKEILLDSIGIQYIRTKDKKYLEALNGILQNPKANVEGLYTDVLRRFIENDFGGFINQLYLAKGRYAPLEKELVGAMNMIVNGRPYKQRYMGLLNLEISKAKDAKDNYKTYYLEKLKTRIEEDR